MKFHFYCFILIVTPITLISQSTGYIQIKAESGLSVFVDDFFKGKTNSEFGGLIISDVSVGSHILKIIKDGYQPQIVTVKIISGQVYIYEVKNFEHKIEISQTGSEDEGEISIKTGKLLIQSLPVNIKIEISSLSINSLKTKDRWETENIPEGRFLVSFYYNSQKLSSYIVIEEKVLTHIFVNFIENKVLTLKSGIISDGHFIDINNPDEYAFGSFTDLRDGKKYKWVKVGDLTWMAENLNIGIEVSQSQQLNNGQIEKSCPTGNCTKDGAGYKWGEVMQYSEEEKAQGVCPDGWHVPSLNEWLYLAACADTENNYEYYKYKGSLGRGKDAALNLKSKTGWAEDGNGKDVFGINIKPFLYGSWKAGSFAGFWASSPYRKGDRWTPSFTNTSNWIIIFSSRVYDAVLPVRCVKNTKLN
ncbi:MAG: hypothetical protein K8R86_09885 [Bacteroidales bacterium]|nr:hypothetical protein [Bacteroidales bacterium]